MDTEHLEAVLRVADLDQAREQITFMHQMLNDEAKKEGSVAIFPQAYAQSWQAFRDKPTIETARAFLIVAPQLLQAFEEACPGHQLHDTRKFLKDQGVG